MTKSNYIVAVLAALVIVGCGTTTTTTTTKVVKVVTGCGIERWAVKTGTDPLASTVNTTPQDTTITKLSAVSAPMNPTTRVSGLETQAWTVHVNISAIKEEEDGDYHLAIDDGQGHTMIAEAPDPSCASGSQWVSQIKDVRNAINQACPTIPTDTYRKVNIPAALTGVGFFDRIHGQRGVAPNGIELHPLLAVQLTGVC